VIRDLFSKGLLAFSMKIIGLSFTYLFTLLVSRIFGPESMGIFSLSVALLMIITIIGRFGLDTTLLRYVSEFSSQNKWSSVKRIHSLAVKISFILSILLFISFFSFSSYLADVLFGKPNYTNYFRIISFAVLLLPIRYINGESLRGLKKIGIYAFLEFASIYLFSSILLLTAAFFWKNKYLPVLAIIMGIFLSFNISQWFWRKSIRASSAKEVTEVKLSSLMEVSFPLFLSSIMMFLIQCADTIILGIYRTSSELGIYNVTMRMGALTSLPLLAINSIIAPKFAEIYAARDLRNLELIAQHATKMLFWSSIPILLLVITIPKTLLSIFGHEFEKGVIALILISLGQFASSISGSVGYLLQMTGRQVIFQKIVFATLTINVVANFILIPRFGINGAAFTSMLSMIVWNSISIMMIHKELGIKTFYLPFFNLSRNE